jgi:phosphoribosylformylglycinamidine cyclo-ligase
MAPDGDGTKVVLTDAAGDYDNAAYGWIAMTCGDITRWGGIPLGLVNILDTASIGKLGDPVNNAFRSMLISAKQIADENQLVLFKGETAELPGCVTSPNDNALAKYLWSGVAFGAYNPRTIITGDQIREGMIVMALRELGFRNNGISSVRTAITMKFGSLSCPEAQEAVKRAATHAVIYDKFLATANGWFAKDFKPVIPMYLVAHLTGGAIRSKFAEDILFPQELSAHLFDLWEPPDIMRRCAEWRGMTDEECYETWHGGQGALVVIDAVDEQRFTDLAVRFGIKARRAGPILKKERPTVIIKSKFKGGKITWSAK